MASSGGSLLTFVARRLLITVLAAVSHLSRRLFAHPDHPGNPAIALAGGAKATPSEIAKITGATPPQRGLLRAVLDLAAGGRCTGTSATPSSTTKRWRRESPPVSLSRSASRRRDGGGHPDRPPRGHPLGAASGYGPRPRGHRGLEHRRRHPRLLAGHAPRDRLRGEAGVASRSWLHAVHPVTGRMVPGPLPAVAGARHRRLGRDRPPGTRRAHRHPRPGLHADRGGQGAQSPHGGRQACPQERPEPGRHGDRHPVRLPARGHAHHRADLLPARARAPTSSRPSRTRTSRRSRGWCSSWRPPSSSSTSSSTSSTPT